MFTCMKKAVTASPIISGTAKYPKTSISQVKIEVSVSCKNDNNGVRNDSQSWPGKGDRNK